MSFLDQIGVLILTYNEAPNIGRTLEALRDFPEIVVLDSGSSDETAAIVHRFLNARFVTRPFDDHAMQWNFGLTACGLTRPWILALDADYLLTPELVIEIACLRPAPDRAGFRVGFNYCVQGKRLSGALYPPVTVLFRRERGRYEQFGHTQRLVIDGEVTDLKRTIDHDDRKPLSRWFASQQKYAALEVDHLLATPRADLRLSGRLRLVGWPAPIAVFLYTLIAKGCILDGSRGWFYILQRTLAEILIALELLARRLSAENRQRRD